MTFHKSYYVSSTFVAKSWFYKHLLNSFRSTRYISQSKEGIYSLLCDDMYLWYHTGNVAHESVNRAYACVVGRLSTSSVTMKVTLYHTSLQQYSTSHASLRAPVQQLFAELSQAPLTISWQRQLQVNRSTVLCHLCRAK